MVIASFLQDPPQAAELEDCQRLLHEGSKPGTTFLHQKAGVGFYYVSTDSPWTTQHLLATAAHQVGAKMVIYQGWVPSFNPLKPYGILVPTWIILRFVLLEFIEMVQLIAGIVGRVLLADQASSKTPHLRFCVGLDLSQGWIASVAVPNL
jgi:hypothetical protein